MRTLMIALTAVIVCSPNSATAQCTGLTLCAGDSQFQKFSNTVKLTESMVEAVATTQIVHTTSHPTCTNGVGSKAHIMRAITFVASSAVEYDSHANSVATKKKSMLQAGTYHAMGDHYWAGVYRCSTDGLDKDLLGQGGPAPATCYLETEDCQFAFGPTYDVDPATCACYKFASPIVIDTAGDGYSLSGVSQGVTFDLDADGSPDQVSWTSTGSDDAILVLDKNRNGVIDDGSELMGNAWRLGDGTVAESGFEALLELDGGASSDFAITPEDAVYADLRLWQDLNHNGYSENNELLTLADAGIVRLSLEYKASNKRDQYGNRFALRAAALQKNANGIAVPRYFFDVFLLKLGTISPE